MPFSRTFLSTHTAMRRVATLSAAAFLAYVGAADLIHAFGWMLSGGAPHDRQAAAVAGIVGIAMAIAVLLVPWRLLPRWAMVALPFAGFAYFIAADAAMKAAASPNHYAMFLPTILASLMWVGLTQPRYTALALTPLCAIWVAVEVLTPGSDFPLVVALVCVAPFVIFAEVVAWIMGRLRKSEEEEHQRVVALTSLNELLAGLRTAVEPGDVASALVSGLEHIYATDSVSVVLEGQTSRDVSLKSPEDDESPRSLVNLEAAAVYETITIQFGRDGTPWRGFALVEPPQEIDPWFSSYLNRLLTLEINLRLDELEARKSLESAALVDPLTSVGNRRAADAGLTALGIGDPVFVIDVDRFKEVNDRRGHAVGDDLLRSLAATLEMSVREGDIVARLGGDEFVIILPNSKVSASDFAARLLSAWRGKNPAASVSIGIAVRAGAERPEATLDRADRALYAAKERGGNTWTVEEENQPATMLRLIG